MATKVDMKKFRGQNDFNRLKIKMKALLITQGLGHAINQLPRLKEKRLHPKKTLEQVVEIDKMARIEENKRSC